MRNTRTAGRCCFRKADTPAIVPPVPAPLTKASTLPPVCSQTSRPAGQGGAGRACRQAVWSRTENAPGMVPHSRWASTALPAAGALSPTTALQAPLLPTPAPPHAGHRPPVARWALKLARLWNWSANTALGASAARRCATFTKWPGWVMETGRTRCTSAPSACGSTRGKEKGAVANTAHRWRSADPLLGQIPPVRCTGRVEPAAVVPSPPAGSAPSLSPRRPAWR